MEPEEPVRFGPALKVRAQRRASTTLGAWRSDGAARWLFIWPAIVLILILSIFPLVVSLVLSFGQLVFQRGSVSIDFVGGQNYSELLFGLERTHFLGLLQPPNLLGWAVMALTIACSGWWFARSIRSRRSKPLGLAIRLIASVALVGFVWLLVQALASEGGRPGALVVTLIFVFGGIALQLLLGLGLALLAVQALPLRRFFRIVFLVPLTITPVGVGYMLRMVTDTTKGPLHPLFVAFGGRDYTWVNDPWAARIVVILGDTWQWTPFVFIVLLAAIESLDQEVREAAWVDGASRWQSFIHVTLPAILPVASTIVLIRLIEGFKIVDLPSILLGGGPGTATQSMTLQAYFDWSTLNLGRSAAIAYLLLIVVTIVATAYVSFVRRRVTDLV